MLKLNKYRIKEILVICFFMLFLIISIYFIVSDVLLIKINLPLYINIFLRVITSMYIMFYVICYYNDNDNLLNSKDKKENLNIKNIIIMFLLLCIALAIFELDQNKLKHIDTILLFPFSITFILVSFALKKNNLTKHFSDCEKSARLF